MRFQDQAEKLALTTCFRIKPDKSSGLGSSEYIPIPFMSWQFGRVTGSISRAALSLFLQEKIKGWQLTATSKKSNTPCVSLVYCLPYLSDESDVNYWISKTQTWQQQLPLWLKASRDEMILLNGVSPGAWPTSGVSQAFRSLCHPPQLEWQNNSRVGHAFFRFPPPKHGSSLQLGSVFPMRRGQPSAPTSSYIWWPGHQQLLAPFLILHPKAAAVLLQGRTAHVLTSGSWK